VRHVHRMIRNIPKRNDRVAERGDLSVTGTVIAERPGTTFVCIRWDSTWTAPPPMWQDTATLVVLSSPAV
jgi:hypothetical protein